MVRHLVRGVVACVLGVTAVGGPAAPADPAASAAPALQAATPKFQLPLIQSAGDSADPYIVWNDPDGAGSAPGYYVMLYNKAGFFDTGIVARKAPSLQALRYAPDQVIYQASADPTLPGDVQKGTGYGSAITSYNNLWYIYGVGSDGPASHDKPIVLESAGPDPMGPYHFKAKLPPTGRILNGTGQPDPYSYAPMPITINGQRYVAVTSGTNDVWQIRLAKLTNPWTLQDPVNGWKVITQAASSGWECANGRCIDEGGSVTEHGGMVFFAFAAGGFESPDYCTGLLTASASADPLVQANWTKSSDCVFERKDANGVYGPVGQFFKSPDGTEDWYAYQVRTSPAIDGCCRTLAAEKVTWTSGAPSFGEPAANDTYQTAPSGDTSALDGILVAEAESGTLTGGATVANSGSASGGAYVSSLSAGRSISLTLGTYWARGHKLLLHYSNPGSAAKVNVRVNGGNPTAVSLPTTGAGSDARFAVDHYAVVDLDLAVGPNTVSIEGVSGSVNVDKLVTDYRMVAEAPAVASRGTALDLFATRTDGTVSARSSTDGGTNWSPWTGLGLVGGPATGLQIGPGAVSRKDNWLDLFAVGNDGNVWSKYRPGNAQTPMSSWFSLGAPPPGIAGGGVGVTGRTTDNLDIFVLGADRQVWTRAWHDDATGWTAWTSLGAPPYGLIGTPAAANWWTNEMKVYVVGSDHLVWTRSWSATLGWWFWEPLNPPAAPAGGAMSTVAASSYDGTHTDIVVRGSDGALWTRRLVCCSTWDLTWTKVPNSDAYNADPRGFAVAGRVSGPTPSVDVVARRPAPDNQFWWTTKSDSGWTAWTNLGGP